MEYSVNDILLPLAITVIIDQKVRDPEKQAFIEQASGLIELFELPSMDEDTLMEWFKNQEEELTEKLSSKRRNSTVLRALSRFSDDVYVENIYDAMVAISLSDKEFVQDESDLVKSAGALWGFPKPPIKVDR